MSHTTNRTKILLPNWQYDRKQQKRESLTDLQHSAVHKTANTFLFSARATSTLFELFRPPPPSSPNPLDLFPSQPSCSLHTLGLSLHPCLHNSHHHWGCGKRVQSPTLGRGCRPQWSQLESPPIAACANHIPIPWYIFSLDLNLTVSDLWKNLSQFLEPA